MGVACSVTCNSRDLHSLEQGEDERESCLAFVGDRGKETNRQGSRDVGKLSSSPQSAVTAALVLA